MDGTIKLGKEKKGKDGIEQKKNLLLLLHWRNCGVKKDLKLYE